MFALAIFQIETADGVYETNSSYVFWYGAAEVFPAEAFTKAMTTLKTRVSGRPEYADLVTQFESYAAAANARAHDVQRQLLGT